MKDYLDSHKFFPPLQKARHPVVAVGAFTHLYDFQNFKNNSSIVFCMVKHKIYLMSFASVYPHYVEKARKKGRTKKEVDEIICWLTGYTQKQLESHIQKETTFEDFFKQAKKINSSRKLITGVVCGIRVEDITEKTMREIRYLDKLIDELAKGKAMEKILRES